MLINPRFELSFWGFEHCMRLFGKRANLPVGQYLPAVERLDRFAQERYAKHVIALAVRWVLDQGITTALWGARRPEQLNPVEEVIDWSLDSAAKAEINCIITEPVGPEFMAPPEEL